MPYPMEPLKPRCIGSANEFHTQIVSNSNGEANLENIAREDQPARTKSFFKNVQWSPDGTCVLTNSEDNLLSTYILPPDLLEPAKPFVDLIPYTTHILAEPSYATTPHPQFTLSSPYTALLLTSPRDHPLHLVNALMPSPSPPLATYPLVNPHTEAYLPAHALAFTGNGGTHFVAAAPSLLAVFDISRSGDGPISWLPTIPSRRSKLVGGGVGMKGIIGALDISSEGGMLAAGTYSRWVGLYADEGRGECIAVFPLGEEDTESVGRGITQLLWTPCGRYLLVVERVSDAVLVYDVRVAGKLLGSLKGRRALTNQRMGVSLVASSKTEGGSELWAGGTDGLVRVWNDVTGKEGIQTADWEWEAHGDAVSNTLVHSTGSIAATCAGQRHIDTAFMDPKHSDMESSSESESDTLLDLRNVAGLPEPRRKIASQTGLSAQTETQAPPDQTLKIWAL